jgi:hypothetical protein
MEAVGFSPKNCYSDELVRDALVSLRAAPAVNSWGTTFGEAALRVQFGMVVWKAQLKRVLREIDPEGHERRRRVARPRA